MSPQRTCSRCLVQSAIQGSKQTRYRRGPAKFSSGLQPKERQMTQNLLRNHQMVYACGIAECIRSAPKIRPSLEILSTLIASRNFPRLHNMIHNLLHAYSMFHLHAAQYNYTKMPSSLVSVKVNVLEHANHVPCN